LKDITSGGLEFEDCGIFKNFNSEDFFTESKLLKFDYYNNDDAFYGKYKNLNVYMAEAYLTKSHWWRRGNTTVFDGIFIFIEIKKPFDGKLLAGKKEHMNKKELKELLHLPGRDFLHKFGFDIFTDNPVHAREILTSSFCNLIANIKHTASVIFHKNTMILAIDKEDGFDFFKLGDLFKNVEDEKQYSEFEKDFNLLLGSIDDIINATSPDILY